MEIFEDKVYVELIDNLEALLEVLHKESLKGSLHRVMKNSDTMRNFARKYNEKNHSNEKKNYYFRRLSRGLERSKKELEDQGFSQVELYSLQDTISYVNSLIV
jgi:citrate synthase